MAWRRRHLRSRRRRLPEKSEREIVVCGSRHQSERRASRVRPSSVKVVNRSNVEMRRSPPRETRRVKATRSRRFAKHFYIWSVKPSCNFRSLYATGTSRATLCPVLWLCAARAVRAVRAGRRGTPKGVKRTRRRRVRGLRALCCLLHAIGTCVRPPWLLRRKAPLSSAALRCAQCAQYLRPRLQTMKFSRSAKESSP